MSSVSGWRGEQSELAADVWRRPETGRRALSSLLASPLYMGTLNCRPTPATEERVICHTPAPPHTLLPGLPYSPPTGLPAVPPPQPWKPYIKLSYAAGAMMAIESW